MLDRRKDRYDRRSAVYVLHVLSYSGHFLIYVFFVLIFPSPAYNKGMKLEMKTSAYYRVKRGQSLWDIAAAFRLPPRLIAACNHLNEEPQEGCVLYIPPQDGNLYIVKGGESKSLLCGSKENFEEKNRTKAFYPAQVVLL